MIFMALDHASLMVGRVHFTEIWGVDFTPYPDLLQWGTRFVSHLCAPGFFFLMGMSIYLFGEKSRRADWSPGRIRAYFFKRGALILLLMLLLEVPAFAIAGGAKQVGEAAVMPGQFNGGFFFPGTVLFGLGTCMIVSAFLWQLNRWLLLGISISSFVFSALVIATTDPSEAVNPLWHFFIVPGQSDGALSMYPLIPWLGITTFGIFWARILKNNPSAFFTYSLRVGIGFVLAALSVRALGYGNFQISEYRDWISFFTLIKYPPSLVFSLLMIGVHLILLHVFTRTFGRSWQQPLLIFGQTAMFFYILHLHLYAWTGIAFPMGCHMAVMYAIWLLGLVVLFYLCRWFVAFKKTKPPGSIWRMI